MSSDFFSIPTLMGLIGLFFTLTTILLEQKKYHRVKYDQEKRIEYKLRIFEILLDDILPIGEIITKVNNHSPLKNIDNTEIRKCIYEMIVEKTILAFEDGCYTVDTVTQEN